MLDDRSQRPSGKSHAPTIMTTLARNAKKRACASAESPGSSARIFFEQRPGMAARAEWSNTGANMQSPSRGVIERSRGIDRRTRYHCCARGGKGVKHSESRESGIIEASQSALVTPLWRADQTNIRRPGGDGSHFHLVRFNFLSHVLGVGDHEPPARRR